MKYYKEIIDMIPNKLVKKDLEGNIIEFTLLGYIGALVEYEKITGKMPL